MPLISNNVIINSVSQGPKVPDEPVVIKPPEAPKPIIELEKVSEVSHTRYDKHKHVLIVNGKEKKISKQSAYILDMLTLDDE